MKKQSLYYLVHVAVNLILLIVFFEQIELHYLSVLPLFFLCLMMLQAAWLRAEMKSHDVGDTAYSVGNTVRMTEEEEAQLRSDLRHSFITFLPFEFPLIFFLPSYWKLLGLIPYILAYIVGGAAFKVKMGKQIQNRIREEEKALQEQRKKEELGNMK